MDTLATIVFFLVVCACCGLRCWLVLALSGTAVHLGWFDRVPDMGEPFVILAFSPPLIAFFILHLVEFGIDKTPRFDSRLDRVHALVRPLAGALMGWLTFIHLSLLAALAAAVIGNVIALVVHFKKARFRKKLNEKKPLFATVGVSLAEDVVAGLLLWFAFGVLV